MDGNYGQRLRGFAEYRIVADYTETFRALLRTGIEFRGGMSLTYQYDYDIAQDDIDAM
ncbi:MAG: hypothetical protein J07HQW1_01332 [Haloquadratum walsbyi J07HQW1]|jgi:hypothetical protein|uniref:Uncharacterized protein n=1 Tax=Haloquadratum walsbyi J07HQW1 TaxID=1238424 RepID=U1N4H4_9EURY|nr:MAG: hypothetical protein J07HQW1_01332 [Haloquadratum walsbyi J07HQW1]